MILYLLRDYCLFRSMCHFNDTFLFGGYDFRNCGSSLFRSAIFFKTGVLLPFYFCDAPFPGGPLTTHQPAEYSWMLGNPTSLTKIGQSLLCMGSSIQDTTCPNILRRPHRVHMRVKMATWAHASILIKIQQLYYNSSRVITLLLIKTYIEI